MSTRPHWEHEGRDWPHRAASRFVQAGGLRWHVQRLGPDGPGGWLLLHGTGAASHSWRGLAPLLAATAPVLSLDLPGHGFSQALPAPHCSLPGMAAALGALLRALDMRPAAVLGHSAGAAIMLRLALDGRLPGSTLVGINAALLPFAGLTGLVYGASARLLARSRWVPRLAAWRAGDAAAVRRLIASTGSTLDDEGVALYARLLRSPGHVANVLAMVAHWDLAPLQAQLPRLPSLQLLVAEGDKTVPPEQAAQVAARVPGCRVHRLPGLGHLAHEEAPQRVAALLQTITAP